MKRYLCILLVMAVAFTAMAGCAAQKEITPTKATEASSEKKEEKPTEAPKKVTLSFIRGGTEKEQTEYWQALIKDYTSQKSNITIEYDAAAWGNDLDTKLNTQFAAGNAPDVIGHGIVSIVARAGLNQYAPLDEYLNKWEDKSDIMEGVLRIGTFNNKVYGLGYQATPYVLAYRKDMFKEAGLDPEKPPKNWSELKEFALKLTKKEDGKIVRGGFDIPLLGGNLTDFDIFVYQNGGQLVNDEGMPVLTSPEALEALKFMLSFIPDVLIPARQDQASPFLKGNAAMAFIQNDRLTPMLKDPEMKEKVGMAVPPENKKKATFSGMAMMFINNDSKNKDEAWNFIQFANSKEQVWKRYKAVNFPVTRKSLVEDYAKDDPMNKIRSECVNVGNGMPKVKWSPVFITVRNELVQKVIYKKATPEQALEDAQKKLVEEINRK